MYCRRALGKIADCLRKYFAAAQGRLHVERQGNASRRNGDDSKNEKGYIMVPLVLFISIFTALYLLLSSKTNKHNVAKCIFSAVISGVLLGFSIFKTCASGWMSPSIGMQGACSHHGGVVTNINFIGWVLLCLSLFYIVVRVKKRLR